MVVFCDKFPYRDFPCLIFYLVDYRGIEFMKYFTWLCRYWWRENLLYRKTPALFSTSSPEDTGIRNFTDRSLTLTCWYRYCTVQYIVVLLFKYCGPEPKLQKTKCPKRISKGRLLIWASVTVPTAYIRNTGYWVLVPFEHWCLQFLHMVYYRAYILSLQFWILFHIDSLEFLAEFKPPGSHSYGTRMKG